MDKFRLKLFFCELIKLMYKFPGRPGFGNPVDWLIEQMCVYQDKFLTRIAGDYTGQHHECRLNNAGLKMYWHIDKETRQFKCSIGGDQANDYPEFVAHSRQLIKHYGFNKR